MPSCPQIPDHCPDLESPLNTHIIHKSLTLHISMTPGSAEIPTHVKEISWFLRAEIHLGSSVLPCAQARTESKGRDVLGILFCITWNQHSLSRANTENMAWGEPVMSCSKLHRRLLFVVGTMHSLALYPHRLSNLSRLVRAGWFPTPKTTDDIFHL